MFRSNFTQIEIIDYINEFALKTNNFAIVFNAAVIVLLMVIKAISTVIDMVINMAITMVMVMVMERIPSFFNYLVKEIVIFNYLFKNFMIFN